MFIRTIALVILLTLIALGAFLWFGWHPVEAVVSSIEVSKPNFVIQGRNLEKVEVYGIPNGTGISPADYTLLGTAVLSSTTPEGIEIWTAPIPSVPLLLTGVLARGYAGGKMRGEAVLPQTGATEVNNMLWGSGTVTTPSDLSLGVGKTGNADGLSITVNSLLQDSRCPIDVQCIQAGAVKTSVTLRAHANILTKNISSDEVPQTFEGYRISIIDVKPPRQSKIQISPSAYVVTFHVEPALDTEDGVVCAADARQCPDGSYVGRSGPTCEFVCPSSSGGIMGLVMLGPTCPVQRVPPDPQCADKPYETRLQIVSDTGAVIKEVASDRTGHFSVSLPDGLYRFRNPPAQMLPRCSSDLISVQRGFTNVTVSCDTGIR